MKCLFRVIAVDIQIILLCFLIFSKNDALADNITNIKITEVKLFQLTNEIPNKVKLIAWSSTENIYFLDLNLKIVKKIVLNKLSFSSIIQVSNSLYIHAKKYNKHKYIEDLIVQYDINNGNEKNRWINDNYLIWSLTSDNNKLVVMSSDGKQLKLTSNGFEVSAKHPRRSHYVSLDRQEPVICTDADTTKLNWKLASCSREGKYNWNKDGEWGRLLRPFICNNYLIENNKKPLRRKFSASISVRDITNGEEVAKKDVDKVLAISCIGTNIIHGLNSSIIVRQIPSLKIIHTVKTKSKRIESVTMIGNSIYWVDGRYKLHKRVIQ